ncbi:MAG: hypothetical protein WCG83_01915 [Candidatus Peregrinibacteria bacterium]
MRKMPFSSIPVLLLLCGVLLSLAGSSHAETTASGPLCTDAVERSLASEERLYRSVLFGSTKAAEARAGEVRFDREGNAWIKTDQNLWRTMATGREEEQRRDAEMETAREFPVRSGIFQTRGVLTSDLVPSLTQAFRALQCRTLVLCRTAELSLNREGQDFMTIEVPGCIREQRKAMPACQIAEAGGTRIAAGNVLTHCRDIRKSLLDHEETMLLTAVENDASYRSLLQIEGNFDAFLLSIRWPIAGTLRSVVGLLGTLSRIPCFSGSCEPAPLP